VTVATSQKAAALWLEPGDLLIERSNTAELVGTAAVFRGPKNYAIFPDLIIRARLNREVSDRYVEYFLASERARAHFRQAAQGIAGSMPKISQEVIERLRVPLPERSVQDRIVGEIEKQFTRLDAGLASLKRLKAHLRRYRVALLASAFREFRNVVPFRTVLREPLRNGHSAPKSERDGGIRTLTLSAVTEGEFTERNTKITSADPERVRDLWLQPGDVLIERSNTPELVGTARVYRGRRDWAIYPDLLIRARLVPEVSDRFVEYFLASEQAREYFRRSAQGIAGSMPKISQPTIEALLIPLPSRGEQDQVAQRLAQQLSVVDAVERSAATSTRKASALRASILRYAFEGRLAPGQS
jgi:type I restriction enzyme, S subunit